MHRRTDRFVLPLAMALGYFALARLAMQFIDPWSHVAALWPASGLAAGVFASVRESRWRWLMASVFAGDLAAQLSFHSPLVLTLGLPVVSAVEPLVVASVLRAVGGEGVGLNTIRRANGLLVAALSNGLTALAGGALVTLATAGSFGHSFVMWWLSNGVGIMVLAPMVMAFAERPPRIRAGLRLEPLVVLAVFIGLCLVVYTSSPAHALTGYTFILLPPAIWATLRTGGRTISSMVALLSVIGAWGTAHGHGPYASAALSHAGRLETLQGFLVISSGLILALAALIRERRAARESAEQLAQELELLMDSTAEAIYATDMDGRITFANRAAESQTGFSKEQMAGRDAHELMHHSHADGSPYPSSECPIMLARLSGQPCHATDEVFWRADGTCYPVEYSSRPLQDRGRLTGAVVTVSDITERLLAEQRLAAAEARFHRAFSDAPVGIVLVSLDGLILDVNGAFCELLERQREHLVDVPVRQMMHPDDCAVAEGAVRAMVAGRTDSARLELRYMRPDGRLISGLTHTTLVRHPDGSPEHLVTHVLDISERKEFEARLRHLTDHDPLTGLLNRRRFEMELAVYLSQPQGQSAPASVLVLDIDDFKQINDVVGHSAGDELIAAVADILRGSLRDSDVLARLGGDEFAVLLPNTLRPDAEAVAAKLISAVRAATSLPMGHRRRGVTISAGVTEFSPTDGLCADEVIVDADLAMYDAKEAGRDGFAFFAHAQEGHSRTKARMTWVDRIEHAIEEGGFVLDAQPILDLRANEITQHELLLRMFDECGDRIPPGAFLDVAERNGLMPRIDRWVVREAIRLLSEEGPGGALRRFEVNLSGHSIGDPELLEVITADIRSSGVDPSNLIFEITETAAVADIGRARRFADALSELGCRFALDDFGAGFGSFYYLKHLPFDYLKIDGEFIRGCVKSRTDRLVIEAVVQIAQGLGKETVAEFVGDAAIRRVVQRLGVDFAQGAYVSMPLPLEQSLELASRRA